MPATAHPFRGPLFMVLATGSYVVNDTMMKVATEALPPYQVLATRGFAALLWGIPLLFMLGYGRRLALMFERRVAVRSLCETAAILCYVVALANMPIADASALGQVTPLLVILGAAILLRERVAPVTIALILVGFFGAILVAQPSGAGISIYALLALANAVMSAVRDLSGRRVADEVPGMIVAMSAVVIVFVGAAVAHLVLENWVAPDPKHLLLLLGAGFFLIFGHFFIFMAYRTGATGLVAPFYYTFTVWAVISGVAVFASVPNSMALAGIALIVVSGLAIVWLDTRRRRLAPVS